jgi:hypothetical protein
MSASRPFRSKQQSLKPQDLLLALKVAANPMRAFTFAQLASELGISVSEVHAACSRAETSKLLVRQNGDLVAVKATLLEFLLHGVKYAFPAMIGAITRGMATGVGASPLKDLFTSSDEAPPVWPDPEEKIRGPSLEPLYPTVAKAARVDHRLYELLALTDALRYGAAREREAARTELMRRL